MTLDFGKLKNCYSAMRHGQSIANVEGIIVSNPATGTCAYGLSEIGRLQVRESASEFLKKNQPCSQVKIISSDFLRARQTAELLAEVIQCHNLITFVEVLRERFFGNFDGQSDEHYTEVWKLDAESPDHQSEGVESVNSVRSRVASLIAELESRNLGQHFILVAHGDVLQIAQTLFEEMPGESHRQLPHLGVGEIRRLN